MNIGKLRIEVDLSEVREATESLEALAAAAERARAALDKLHRHTGPVKINLDTRAV